MRAPTISGSGTSMPITAPPKGTASPFASDCSGQPSGGAGQPQWPEVAITPVTLVATHLQVVLNPFASKFSSRTCPAETDYNPPPLEKANVEGLPGQRPTPQHPVI
jgi:hypothetical protein